MTRFVSVFGLAALLLVFSASMAATLKPVPGKPVPPTLKLMDLKGQTHDLAQYRGKIILVQFWATYCPPCRKEMPSMNRLMKKMGDTPFAILAVNMGEPADAVQAFIDEVGAEFTVLLDVNGDAIGTWKVFAAPSNFIIGPQGRVRYTLFGGVDWDSDDMVKTLRALANE